MSWKKVKLEEVLKQYRIEVLVQDDTIYKQVTISKHDGVGFRGEKIGNDIGRKRQFQIDLDTYPDTLLLVRQGVYDGAIGLAPREVHGCIATENMPMFCVKNVIPDFLSLLLQSQLFKAELAKIPLTGSAQKSVHERQILDIEVPMPSPEEQRRILSRWKETQKSLKLTGTEFSNQLALIKKLRQSLLQDAVQGRLVAQDGAEEPADQLLQKIKAEKAALIAAKKLKKEKDLPAIAAGEEPFDLPAGWVWCRLGEVGILKRGKSKHRPRDDKRLFEDGIYPFIQTGDVSKAKFHGDIITTKNNFYSAFGLAQSELQLKGTLCITIAANIAECGFLGFDACAPDSIVCFVTEKEAIKKYVYYFVKTAKEHLEKYAPATAQKNINLGILNQLPIPLPPLAEQQRIVAKLESVMTFCDGLEARVAESRKAAELLLQTALREALASPAEEKGQAVLF